jgi:hypothetical protein
MCHICVAQEMLSNLFKLSTTERATVPSVVPCNPNTFWLNCGDANTPGVFNIREYTLINNTVAYTGNIIYNVPNASIAYANISSSLGSTFYDIDFGLSGDLLEYNGVSWTHYPVSSNLQVVNCGGGLNTLAYLAKDSTNYQDRVLLYNGVNLYEIYRSDTLMAITVADIAVDSLQYIYLFEAFNSTYLTPYSLKVLDSSGNFYNQFFFKSGLVFSADYAYGMFILNNTIYVGLGNTNPYYPNTLVPFNIVNDSVLMGIPIPFVAPASRFDLESCNQGTLTSVKEVPASYKQLSVYPNPATDQFSVYIPYGTNANAQIIVTNLQGATLEDRLVKDNKIPINCELWPAGMYLVSVVSNDKGIVTAKVLKQ